MNSITIRINKDENALIRDYAKANNISISELIRRSVLEKIETEIDLKIYNEAIRKHKENPQEISFDQMIKELEFNE